MNRRDVDIPAIEKSLAFASTQEAFKTDYEAEWLLQGTQERAMVVMVDEKNATAMAEARAQNHQCLPRLVSYTCDIQYHRNLLGEACNKLKKHDQ